MHSIICHEDDFSLHYNTLHYHESMGHQKQILRSGTYQHIYLEYMQRDKCQQKQQV
jgi:hypothetical protein